MYSDLLQIERGENGTENVQTLSAQLDEYSSEPILAVYVLVLLPIFNPDHLTGNKRCQNTSLRKIVIGKPTNI